MNLILEVTSPEAASLGSGRRKVFSTAGGTIGRASSSDWILSHRKVSGRHASISYQDAIFYIVDERSANGVFLNSTKNRLVPGKRYGLKAGDRIIIDPYEMEVSISAADTDQTRSPFDESGRGYDPFGGVDPFGPPDVRTPAPVHPAQPPPRSTPAGQAVPSEEVDPLKLLGGTPAPGPPRHAPRADDLESKGPLAGHYQPPAVRTPPPATPPPAPSPAAPPRPAYVIPEDYDPLRDGDYEEPIASAPPPLEAAPVPAAPPDAPIAAPPPTPVAEARAEPTPSQRVPLQPEDAAPETPAREPAAPVSPDPGLVAVLEGAGLDRAPVTAEFARSFGQIFRVVVEGVMDVLRARQQIKDEFRMRMTQFRPADNNPLKFSANVDDALHNLLVKRNAAYLEPVEAFEDAFDDLRDHQIAMLAGMRVAFESMVSQFNPEHLQARFDRQLKRTPLASMTSKLRYWDLYCERHEEMVKDPEATFRRLFGEEFAKAYEEQLRRLKAEGRARRAHSKPSDP